MQKFKKGNYVHTKDNSFDGYIHDHKCVGDRLIYEVINPSDKKRKDPRWFYAKDLDFGYRKGAGWYDHSCPAARQREKNETVIMSPFSQTDPAYDSNSTIHVETQDQEYNILMTVEDLENVCNAVLNTYPRKTKLYDKLYERLNRIYDLENEEASYEDPETCICDDDGECSRCSK